MVSPVVTSFEEILISNIGGFGKAQVLVLFACMTIQFFCSWSMLMTSFTAMEPDWWSESIVHNTTSKWYPESDAKQVIFIEGE